jgi:hypothetical protein
VRPLRGGLRRVEISMRYFDESAPQPEKIGKVIGDMLAVCIYLFVLVLMFVSFL